MTATYSCRECEDIEHEIKRRLRPNGVTQCRCNAATKDYTVIVVSPAGEKQIVITPEQYQNHDWTTRVRNELAVTQPSDPRCPACQRLEATLNKLQHIHAEKLGELRSNMHWVHLDEYRRFQAAEDEARTNLDNARNDLRDHQGIHRNEI